MNARRGSPALLFVEVLLWFLGIASLLGPLAIPFGAAPDRAFWIRALSLVLVGVLTCTAAYLVRQRKRVGMFQSWVRPLWPSSHLWLSTRDFP